MVLLFLLMKELILIAYITSKILQTSFLMLIKLTKSLGSGWRLEVDPI